MTSAASGEEQISDVLSCRRDVGELRSGLENGGWPQLSSNCLLTSKPRSLRGLVVLPLQVAFCCSCVPAQEREMMGGRAI